MQINVFYADARALRSAAPDFFARFERTLVPALRDRHARYRRGEDRDLRTLGVWLLARLVESFGHTADLLRRLGHQPSGRPFFDGLEGFDFNLSHSGGYVVCAGAAGAHVGVDIEHMRPVNLSDFRDVFAPETWDGILRAPDPQRAFFGRWTQLESVVKADGCGLGGPIKEVRFGPDSAWSRGKQWFLRELRVADGYACHVATGASEFRVESALLSPHPLTLN